MLCAFVAEAQLNINYTVNAVQDRHDISPYIYGINNGVYKKATWRRWGGNRTSAYNWENNYSNAGADYFDQNDDYLPWAMNLPANQYHDPAQCLIAFHDSALAQNAVSGITLPMVGWAANDGDGQVLVSEVAPSPRWAQVQDIKGAPFTLAPDTADGKIYVDEELNFLLHTFGAASTATGIKAYIMDNEPGLWCNQFQHMRTNCVTYNELFTKTDTLAAVVKSMDSSALVMGPELFGFSAYWDLQNAADKAGYAADHWFIDSYLKHMQQSSAAVGHRLLDVLSVHWYPDITGVQVYSDDTDQHTCIERMQCIRTLWDSSYVEDSWIGTWYASELPIIPNIKHSIGQFYPGTKFAINEYDYGGHHHISGGIAQADALGAFGKTGVDYAALWGSIEGYNISAFDLYRNYDGNNNTYGGIYVGASCNNADSSSVYASVEDSTNQVMHIIVLNKSGSNTINATINIQNAVTYNKADLYYFDAQDTGIQHLSLSPAVLNNNTLSYNIPPYTACHFVLRDTAVLAVNELKSGQPELSVFPNPSAGAVSISYRSTSNYSGSISITDIQGRVLQVYKGLPEKGEIQTSVPGSGVYFVCYESGPWSKTQKLVILK
jgi:mannan endo-1,4-beta-mannosidase